VRPNLDRETEKHHEKRPVHARQPPVGRAINKTAGPTHNPRPLDLQSASAWMHRSKWASRVGVFVNLEALGPGGVPIVFQHTGAWTIRAYARGAKYPRGAITAQAGGWCMRVTARAGACV
jgi:hypothetical protein